MPDMPLGKRAAAFQKLLKLQQESAEAEAVAVAAANSSTASTSSLPPITNSEFMTKEENVIINSECVTKEENVVDNSKTKISVMVSDSIIVDDKDNVTVNLNLDNIPGMQTEGEKYVIMFTCNVCETRSARKISKRGYHHGVVICRCEKCRNLHLIADRMGVFEDESWDIQKHMQKLLEKQNISVSHEADVLEVTVDEEGDDDDSDDEEPSCADNIDLTQIQRDLERELGPGPMK